MPRRYEFGYLEEEAAFAGALTHGQFLSFIDAHLLGGRVLALWVTSGDSTAEDVAPPPGVTLLDKDADVDAFRATQAVYTRAHKE